MPDTAAGRGSVPLRIPRLHSLRPFPAWWTPAQGRCPLPRDVETAAECSPACPKSGVPELHESRVWDERATDVGEEKRRDRLERDWRVVVGNVNFWARIQVVVTGRDIRIVTKGPRGYPKSQKENVI